MGFAPAIDYREFRSTGDAKAVWESHSCQRHFKCETPGWSFNFPYS